MTSYDNLDIGTLGERKRAIFCVIPDNDNSFNYLVGMLYTQAFQALYFNADSNHGGELPVPVHIVMDEFANVALPDNFERILATMRSRRISVSIIIQNMAQLKALFKDSWENITGNCDTLLYLGGNEQSTHEYISKMLGKETIDTRTRGITKGQHGSSIGLILFGFGVVQIGLSLKSHDASQRANGFLTFFGGVIIAFAKDILDMIM